MENIKSLEQLAQPVNSYRYVIIRPGGNDTCLVNGIVENPAERKRINDLIMNIYPNVEQVGFTDINSSRLQMAGGEFCGNATRSTAWLSLNGQLGEIELSVSGVNSKLKAGVIENGEAFAQMPIYTDPAKITKDPENPNGYVVELQGITQYINFNMKEIQGLNPEEIKQKGKETINRLGLTKYPAAGIIYTGIIDGGMEIKPVVWVKEIDTLFLETACASGTAALGQVLALRNGQSIKDVSVKQPSGISMKVSVEYDGRQFRYAQIGGPIEQLSVGVIEKAKDFNYIIESIDELGKLEETNSSDLIQLYQAVFGEPPYSEKFEQQEVKEFFEEYAKTGKLLAARTSNRIIGFAAIVPFPGSQPELPQLAKQAGIKLKGDEWYFSDLGVDANYRKQGIATNLVNELLREIAKETNVILRTSIENNKALALYKKLGFSVIENMRQSVSGARVDGDFKDDLRVFLIKSF